MNFAEAAKNETIKTFTENGMQAYTTTKSACLDFFSVVGALRDSKGNIDFDRAETLFVEALKENPLYAIRTLFYARDIREGLGEREVIRHLLTYTANNHALYLVSNLKLIPEYGRWDDMYCFVGTLLEKEMWEIMRDQFRKDFRDMVYNKPVSLLAKWIKTPDASSEKTRKLGILTAKELGYSNVRMFKHALRQLRKYLRIVERDMSSNNWDKINYPTVPSYCMMKNRNAFNRHDTERFQEFINKAVAGEVKINSSTLYPYDIVEKILYGSEDSSVLEAQWRQLPNYVEPGQNVLVVADTSGSMYGRPLATSVGLAIYFAERNVGAFHNLFMTFSEHPDFINVKGETLKQKIYNAEKANWGWNTNIEEVFFEILEVAKKNHVSAEEMPKSIVIISDMEFDDCVEGTFLDMVESKYAEAGYQIPTIVFWNVESRHDTVHVSKDQKNTVLVSGQSASTFKQLVNCLDKTPYEMMEEILNSDRYKDIMV